MGVAISVASLTAGVSFWLPDDTAAKMIAEMDSLIQSIDRELEVQAVAQPAQ